MESSSAPRAEPEAELISIDTFGQIDLRVGQVVRAEPEPRQLLAGIAEWYAPEGLVGQKILVVANLQPRRMRGLESRGMLLAASADDGRPLLATVPPETPNGSRLR